MGSRVRVLLVNYRYFVSGGPERYLFGVTELLEQAGHEVVPFSVRYSLNEPTEWADYFVSPIGSEDELRFADHERSFKTSVKAVTRAFYSAEVYRATKRIIEAARPDVAYVLHYLRKMGPAVLSALKDAGVPTVVRFSDFGMICPNAHFLRDGAVCELCADGALMPSVKHRCVQGSLGASAVNALATRAHRMTRVFDSIDTFVCPTEIMATKMQAAGQFRSRFIVLPTFTTAPATAVSDAAPERPADGVRSVCYIGRLNPEKGVGVLIDAANALAEGMGDRIRIDLVGTGPDAYAQSLRDRLTPEAARIVRFLGKLDKAGVEAVLRASDLSIVPSVWYENMPNSLLESWAVGTPVVASDIGSLHDMVAGSGAGELFETGSAESLALTVERLLAEPGRLVMMSERARALAATTYAPKTHLEGLVDVLEGARSRGAAR